MLTWAAVRTKDSGLMLFCFLTAFFCDVAIVAVIAASFGAFQ